MTQEKRALIGHTGFVGGILKNGLDFDGYFNSRNIADIHGQEYDCLYVAAAPAEKWRANQDPTADQATIRGLMEHLNKVRARELVLISTVDVYPNPIDVDEDSPIDTSKCQPYGRHRLMLEHHLASAFDTTILRLPGLFGPGLKKNVIYDYLNNNMIERIDTRGIFQFYDLANLVVDIERTRNAGIKLINLAVEPVQVSQLAPICLGQNHENHVLDQPARYDFKSRHAPLWGGLDGYLYSAEDCLKRLQSFVHSVKAA